MSKRKRAGGETDWLVIISLAGGAGSWARGADRAETIKRAGRIFKSDWKSMLDFRGGLAVKANVLNVSGFDRVEWDHSVRVDGKPFTGEIEMVEIKL